MLRDPAGYDTAGSLAWTPGWLPATHGGTEFSSKGPPVHNLRPPANLKPDARRDDLDLLAKLQARRVRLVNLVAAPEGIRRVRQRHPNLPIFTAAIDKRLNEKGYILPGLGDAGDRLFGV